MLENEIAALREAHSKSTPGPFLTYYDASFSGVAVVADGGKGRIAHFRDGGNILTDEVYANAELFILAHNTLPALLAELDRLTAREAAMQAVVDAAERVISDLGDCGLVEPLQNALDALKENANGNH